MNGFVRKGTCADGERIRLFGGCADEHIRLFGGCADEAHCGVV